MDSVATEREVSADVVVLADDVARADEAEFELAVVTAHAIRELIPRDTRSERVAALHYLTLVS